MPSNIYQSEFTGEQMDARFAAVAELQSAVTALETAVAAKYAKPADGIPSTDMDAAVQNALAKALTAVQSLADYYTKSETDALLAAIAASVNATAGVTAASLPTASASTVGKMYYIGPDGNGEYARYVTAYDGTTYSWLAVGTTDIDLTQYATKAEVSQLDQKLSEKIQLLQLEELPMAVQTQAWKNPTTMTHYVIPVNGGDSVLFDNTAGTLYCAFLKSYTTPVLDAVPDFCTGYEGRQMKSESLGAFTLPSDCRFFIINNPNGNWALSSLKINGIEMMQGVRGGLSFLAKSANDIIGLKSSHTFLTCYTGESTVEKAIANDQVPQLTVDKSLRVLVYFISANSADNATLNIRYTVQPLYYRGARASSTNTWKAGDVLDIRYDETNERYMAEPWNGVALASEVQNSIKTSDLTHTITSDNIAFADGIVEDYLVADGGAILPTTLGWCMYKLPVTPGTILTVGGFYLGRSGYYAFYNGDTLVEYHGLIDPDGTTTPLTVTIPTGVTHFYFDIKSPLSPENPYAFLQINVGNSLLPYDTPTREISEINGERIAGSGNAEIPDLLADLPVSDGTDISSGYAYIDSSTRNVKVKA